MKMKQALIAVAAVLVFAAARNAYATNPTNINIAISGSSAIWLELGQASALTQPCVWDDLNEGKDATLTDTRPSPSKTDTGHLWITWTTAGGSCGAPDSGYSVNIFVNADSTIGNRCYLASPRCLLTLSSTDSYAGDCVVDATGATCETTLPGFMVTLINTAQSSTGVSMNGAATDIRPEDAAFATERALTPCGNVVSGQYLGLGYQTSGSPTTGIGTTITGSSFQGSGTGGTFNVLAFNLTGRDPILTSNTLPAFPTIIEVGAVPIVVFVNPHNASGFGSLQISNVDSGVLAGYLDGSFRSTSDMIPGNVSTAGSPANVFVREPLSGTYNTMEYNIVNTLGNQSSQDVGVWAKAVNGTNPAGGGDPFYDCTATGGFVAENPLADIDPNSTAERARAIGTGNMVKAVTAETTTASYDNLGYAFWSVANFAPGSFSPVLASNAKYLTVDGIDPLRDTWVDGLIPQTSNGLVSDVTLSHVRDGSYPIWSFLRVYGDNDPALQTLVNSAYAFELGLGLPSQPDFIPVSSSTVGAMGLVRSHFTPPGTPPWPDPELIACGAPSNGNSLGSESAECGGDVGGIVYTQQADGDWAGNNTSSSGITGRRK
jgi:hypothetical protein